MLYDYPEPNLVIQYEIKEIIKKDLKILNENTSKILGYVLEHDPITRGDLMEKSGIPWTTLYDNLTKLRLDDWIISFDEERTTRGRPKVFYKSNISEKYKYIICLYTSFDDQKVLGLFLHFK